MNNRLVWFTGAPGSKWSGVSTIIQAIDHLGFNIADRDNSDQYLHPPKINSKFSPTHLGSYFGPGGSAGKDFVTMSNLDPKDIENEILSQWGDSSHTGRLLVRSHFFTHHLDYIAETWKENPIIMIIRSNNSCIRGWNSAGGWDITYPDYKQFYKDNNTLKKYVCEHNQKILEFCNSHNLEIKKLTDRCLYELFNWKASDIHDLPTRLHIFKYLRHIQESDDIRIAIYNKNYFDRS